jgi:hypothetical protein
MTDAASATTTTTTTSTPNTTRVLGLVRCLIDVGRRLADTFRNPPPEPNTNEWFELRFRAGLFNTSDVAHILLRIARGLRRAAALQALLLSRAQRGRDIKTAPISIHLPRVPSAAPEPRAERPPLPLEPSDEEIAADVRRRPVGAVIVDICRDLGVLPGDLGGEMHKELTDTVMFYGGNFLRLLRMDVAKQREREWLAILRSGAPLPPELQPFPVPLAKLAEFIAATGPPA